jgi:hypothetical protein
MTSIDELKADFSRKLESSRQAKEAELQADVAALREVLRRGGPTRQCKRAGPSGRNEARFFRARRLKTAELI